MTRSSVDVLIVGGGPTGLALANALGAQSLRVMLVEQDPGVATLPRAVSIDDEAMRFLQRLGLRREAEKVALPGTGTKYYGARGQLLAYARGPSYPRLGFPVKNPIDHASFQQMLLDGARLCPHVELRHRTAFLSFEQDATGVMTAIERPDGRETVRSLYLVGCDGGRSQVRVAIGQEPMSGLAFSERWLVVDTANDDHDERYAMHHGDPRRPRVVIVGRDGRCRYEFLIQDGERPEGEEVVELARRLIAPYRRLSDDDIVRATIYQFYALVARRWSEGRVYLAGDAAHMMPPFAGQGLNTGLRDASNLAWKLGAVLSGRASEQLLETYEQERRPHAEATVRLSVRMGAVMMTVSPLRATVRDAVVSVGQRLPRFRRFFREMRFRPDPDYSQGFAIAEGGEPVGRQLCQPRVLLPDGTIVDLDDILGSGFALLGVAIDAAELEKLDASIWSRLDASRVVVALGDRLPRPNGTIAAVADLDGQLAEQLGRWTGRVVVVRPDRFIAGTFRPADEQTFAARLEQRLGISMPAPVGSKGA